MEGIAARTAASSPPAPLAVYAGPAEDIEPRAVAAWLQVGAWSVNGDVGPGGFEVCASVERQEADGLRPPRDKTGMVLRRLTPPPAPIAVACADAADIHPPPDLEGVYVYIDPPYEGTTGYAAKMPRDTVLAVARRWSDAGAVVCVSEAVPLPLDGWHHVEITDARRGQRRTFSRQQSEWLTINREPVEVPVQQIGLFR